MVRIAGILIMILTLSGAVDSNAGESPYPKSDLTIDWDFSTHERQAVGSDIWGVTWASDNHQYAVWGDGGGFAGTNTKCRVDGMGVARIEGTFDNYKGIDRYGQRGWRCKSECEWDGKPFWAFNLISVKGTLYAFINNPQTRSRLIYSDDFSCKWNSPGWELGKNQVDRFTFATFLNMGKDYMLRKDDYVYIYGNHRKEIWNDSRDSIFLARVKIAQIKNHDKYEYYSGTKHDVPVWVKSVDRCSPVFEWKGKVSWSNCVSFAPGIDRFLLCFNTEPPKSLKTRLAVFEARSPWGPWREVGVFENWSRFGYTFSYWFSPKWWRGKDLNTFSLLFSGTRESDSFNILSGQVRVVHN